MKFSFKAPGKTFLLGEYSVLSSGPALLFCSKPYFEMHITSGRGKLQGIPPSSLAGQWIQKHLEDFSNVNLYFIDPYPGLGGWGASSSQFLFVSLWSWIRQVEEFPSIQALWSLYQSGLRGDFHLKKSFFEEIREGRQVFTAEKRKEELFFFKKGSGADLVAQWQGGFTEFSALSPFSFSLSERAWPFKEGDFLLLPTGDKVKTHQHLSSLSLEHLDHKSWSLLPSCSKGGLEAFQKGNWGEFLERISDFQKLLESLSFFSQKSLSLMKEMRQWKEVKALKGCGALGADSLVLFFQASDKKSLEQKLKSLGFTFLLSSSQKGEGIQVIQDSKKETKKETEKQREKEI